MPAYLPFPPLAAPTPSMGGFAGARLPLAHVWAPRRRRCSPQITPSR